MKNVNCVFKRVNLLTSAGVNLYVNLGTACVNNEKRATRALIKGREERKAINIE